MLKSILNYEIKASEEVGWAIVLALGVYITQTFATGSLPTDWRAFAASFVAGAGRIVVVTLLKNGKKFTDGLLRT